MTKNKIRKQDIVEEVRFNIDKNAFKGPFHCCKRLTKKFSKKTSYKGIEFNYDVWKCPKCKKEYLDTRQAKILERFWAVQKLLEENLIAIERHINFDGKNYFFRFPKELTKNWQKNNLVDIKVISPEIFLVEIKKHQLKFL